MKRIILVILATVLVLSVLTACSSQSNQAGVPNPVVEYKSVEEINDAAGLEMVQLSGELGYTATGYSVIDGSLAQIFYTDEAEQADITVRKQKGSQDISGIYGVQYSEETVNGITVNTGVYEDYRVAWFAAGGYSYSVSALGVESVAFDKIVSDLTAQAKNGA